MCLVIVSSIIVRTVRTMMNSQATEALLLENEVANMTLDSIEEAVLRTNIDGDITYLNRWVEKMTGWNREAALGRPVGEVKEVLVRSIRGCNNAP